MYIERCLLSVLDQTYQNLEIILIDDCSPDNSIEIAKKVISEHPNRDKAIFTKHEQNRGLSAARNTGINLAAGEYIYFLDSDDEIQPYTIMSMVELCDKYKNVDLVQGSTLTIPINISKSWLNIKDKNLPEYSSDHEWIKKGMLKRFLFSMTAWNKLVSRRLLISNSIYFREGIVHEDELWNFFLSKKVTTIAFCKKDTYLYRINDSGIMSSNLSPTNITSFSTIITEMCKNIDPICKKEQKRCVLELTLYIDYTTTKNKDIHFLRDLIKTNICEVKQLYRSTFLINFLFFLNKRKTHRNKALLFLYYKTEGILKKIIY